MAQRVELVIKDFLMDREFLCCELSLAETFRSNKNWRTSGSWRKGVRLNWLLPYYGSNIGDARTRIWVENIDRVENRDSFGAIAGAAVSSWRKFTT